MGIAFRRDAGVDQDGKAHKRATIDALAVLPTAPAPRPLEQLMSEIRARIKARPAAQDFGKPQSPSNKAVER
jgi:hypothetical protein